MIKKLLLFLCIQTSTKLFSQDSLQQFNYSRNKITLTGMKVLGTWGVANLGGGIAGWATANGTDKYFYQMSAFWGAANLGIATLGYLGARKNLAKNLSPDENLKAQQRIEKTFLINGGLDFVYIGTGIFLRTRGNSRDDIKLKGYGSNVMLQGIFLLVFDGVMYSTQRTNGNKLRRFFEKNDVSFSGRSLGVVHYF